MPTIVVPWGESSTTVPRRRFSDMTSDMAMDIRVLFVSEMKMAATPANTNIRTGDRFCFLSFFACKRRLWNDSILKWYCFTAEKIVILIGEPVISSRSSGVVFLSSSFRCNDLSEAQSLSSLPRNEKTFTGLVVYLYICIYPYIYYI